MWSSFGDRIGDKVRPPLCCGCLHHDDLSLNVTLVGHWPDLGPKCGARTDFFLTQPTWYAKGTLRWEPGTKRLCKDEEKEKDCNNKSRRPR